MAILENIDIDIDRGILQNIDIDKISYRLGFGISNTPTQEPQAKMWKGKEKASLWNLSKGVKIKYVGS